MKCFRLTDLLIYFVYIVEPCSCSIWGDPHYLSFDSVKYDFQGDCDYTLVESCNHGNLPTFKVIGNNDRDKPSSPVSYLRGVRLDYQGTEYQMISSGDLKVDGVIQALPFSTGGDEFVTVTFVPAGKMVRPWSSFFISVRLINGLFIVHTASSIQ